MSENISTSSCAERIQKSSAQSASLKGHCPFPFDSYRCCIIALLDTRVHYELHLGVLKLHCVNLCFFLKGADNWECPERRKHDEPNCNSETVSEDMSRLSGAERVHQTSAQSASIKYNCPFPSA